MAFTSMYAFILQTILTLQIVSVFTETLGVPASTESLRFSVFKPRLYHGRSKRQISSTRDNQNQDNLEHIHDVIIILDIKDKSQHLNLRLNRELIPKGYFEKHQQDGSHVVRRPGEKDMELCYYNGKMRGVDGSWAAFSTCHGLSGVVFDGKELHYVERATNSSNINDTNHFLYSHSDLVTNITCGSEGSVDHVEDLYETISKGKRFKRSSEVIQDPYNANASSRYVELLFVVDKSMYEKLGSNMDNVSNYCKNLANTVNSLFTPLNIIVALVGLVVWTEKDEISIPSEDRIILENFKLYRSDKLITDHPHDHAHLLINELMFGFDWNGIFESSGISILRGICSGNKAVGVTTLYWRKIPVALVVAHEMGHNLGIDHDRCQCDYHSCMMPYHDGEIGPHWNSCSKRDLEKFFNLGYDRCLQNKPYKLHDSPVCGNGFVETGEECDCGLVEYCNNPYCDPTDCKRYRNTVSTTGLTTEITTETSKKQIGKVFTVITDTKKNWFGAYTNCMFKGKGWELASIESEEEYQQVLKQIIAVDKRTTYEGFWLSGITSDDDATFQWFPSNRRVTYNKWHRSQPDHDQGCRNGHCIEINKRFNNEWNDYCCEHEQFYICQSLITDSSSAEETTESDVLEYEEE